MARREHNHHSIGTHRSQREHLSTLHFSTGNGIYLHIASAWRSQQKPMYNRRVTTLIIHPSTEIQQKNAFTLACSYLEVPNQLTTLLQNPDLHFIDGSLTPSIGIDVVRELIRSLRYHPYQSPFQVGLILLANVLTEEAQNSLLKSLEEPSETTQFILTTPHERFLLATIRSRSNCLYIKNKTDATSTSEADSGNDEGNSDIEELLTKDLVDKFLFVEDLLAKEKEHTGTVTHFLRDLTVVYRKKLILETRANKSDAAKVYRAALRQISRAQLFIKRNTNKRLTLENLILLLEVRIMVSR